MKKLKLIVIIITLSLSVTGQKSKVDSARTKFKVLFELQFNTDSYRGCDGSHIPYKIWDENKNRNWLHELFCKKECNVSWNLEKDSKSLKKSTKYLLKIIEPQQDMTFSEYFSAFNDAGYLSLGKEGMEIAIHVGSKVLIDSLLLKVNSNFIQSIKFHHDRISISDLSRIFEDYPATYYESERRVDMNEIYFEGETKRFVVFQKL